MPTSDANSIFLERHSVLFPILSSTDVDIIENQVHPLYIIVDRNQEFFFPLTAFRIHKQKIRRKIVGV